MDGKSNMTRLRTTAYMATNARREANVKVRKREVANMPSSSSDKVANVVSKPVSITGFV